MYNPNDRSPLPPGFLNTGASPQFGHQAAGVQSPDRRLEYGMLADRRPVQAAFDPRQLGQSAFDFLQVDQEKTKPSMPKAYVRPDGLFVLRVNRREPSDRYFKGRQPSKLDSKIFDNLPVIHEDLAKKQVKLQSNKVQIDNKQKELQELDDFVQQPELKKFEDPEMDLKGENRNWQNWVVGTFKPLSASSICGSNKARHTILLLKGPADFDPKDPSERVSMAFDKIRNDCKAEKKAFRDPEFPADDSSIVGFYPEKMHKKKNVRESQWMRPAQYFKGQAYTMWDKTIEPNDVKQGELGDCYFLVALASLAQISDRIKKIIRFKRASDAGVYCFSICLHGVWEEIIIDDKVPCHKDALKPIFSKSTSNELWAVLLEKAWAKVHGGYFNVEAGTLEEALHALTGAPTLHFVIKNGEVLEDHWINLLKAKFSGYALACSTQDFSDRQINDKGTCVKTGLVRSHAYSILGVYEIVFEGGKPRRLTHEEKPNPSNLRLLKIRNPWSKYEWLGKWSDNDKSWTPELKALLGNSKREDDGIFFMAYECFVHNFVNFVVCRVKDNYIFSGNKFTTSPTKPTILSFQITKPGKYSFSLSQVSKRFFREQDQYVYSACSLLIARISSNGEIREVGTGHDNHQHIFVESDCPPGNYIAFIFTPWRRKVNEIGFSIYGPERIDHVLTLLEADLPKDFIIKFFFDKARKDQDKMKQFKGKGLSDIRYMNDISSAGLGYIFFENKSTDVQVTAYLKFSEMAGTVFYPPLKEGHSEMIITPGKQKIVAFRMTDPKAKFFYSQSVMFEPNYNERVNQIKKHGQKQIRLVNGADIGIYLYVLKYDTAICYYYENNSKNLELRELIDFVLVNCELSSELSSLYTQVRPGRGRLATIRVIDETKPLEAQVEDCQFDICEVQLKYVNSMIVK